MSKRKNEVENPEREQATELRRLAMELNQLWRVEASTTTARMVLNKAGREAGEGTASQQALFETASDEAHRRRRALEEYALTKEPETLSDLADLLLLSFVKLDALNASNHPEDDRVVEAVKWALRSSLALLEDRGEGGRLWVAYGILPGERRWSEISERASTEAKPLSTSGVVDATFGWKNWVGIPPTRPA